MLKLSEYAKQHGVTYNTAYNHFTKGLITGAYQLPTGTIVIPDTYTAPQIKETVAIYARVSSSQNKQNLETQVERVSLYCNARGWTVTQIVKECASGLNDKRPKLLTLLQDKSIGKIVVEHSDRLSRFGINYIKILYHGEIVIINQAVEDTQDLMQDFVSLVTSFCARLYGLRRSKRKTNQIIEAVLNDQTIPD